MIDVTAAIIVESGRVLIARRRPEASQAGLWEFPGGKVRRGETRAQCLKREIIEELGLEVEVGEFLGESVHAYPGQTVRLLAFRATVRRGTLALNDHAEVRWADARELEQVAFCPADLPFVAIVKRQVIR
jgi:8-oxo-dGTP diphosphatase